MVLDWVLPSTSLALATSIYFTFNSAIPISTPIVTTNPTPEFTRYYHHRRC
jgi:hypothetical protein